MKIPHENDNLLAQSVHPEPDHAQVIAKRNLKIEMMEILKKLVILFLCRALISTILRNLNLGWGYLILIINPITILKLKKEIKYNVDAY